MKLKPKSGEDGVGWNFAKFSKNETHRRNIIRNVIVFYSGTMVSLEKDWRMYSNSYGSHVKKKRKSTISFIFPAYHFKLKDKSNRLLYHCLNTLQFVFVCKAFNDKKKLKKERKNYFTSSVLFASVTFKPKCASIDTFSGNYVTMSTIYRTWMGAWFSIISQWTPLNLHYKTDWLIDWLIDW